MTDLTMSQFASKDDLLAAQAARIAEMESQLDAIGAGGVEPLRKPASQQAVQAAVPLPLLVRDIARDLEITVPQACIALKPLGNYSTNSAVTAEMARMLRDHFPAPAHPAEGVPAQDVEIKVSAVMLKVAALIEKRVEAEPCAEAEAELLKFLRAALAATQPAAQGMGGQLADELIELLNASGCLKLKKKNHALYIARRIAAK